MNMINLIMNRIIGEKILVAVFLQTIMMGILLFSGDV